MPSTQEFLTKYPEWQPIYDSRVKKWNNRYDKKGHKQIQSYVNVSCSVCGLTKSVRWQPDICGCCFEDGVYRCHSCIDYKELSKKAMETLGAEGRSERRQRQINNMTKEDLSLIALKSYETRIKNGTMNLNTSGLDERYIKAYQTRLQNGTFMRSKMELQIEEEFGGQHSAPEFKYELDCYWPEKHLGVEVDDPMHDEGCHKSQGYHYLKDQYFKSLGITVLHLTFHHGDWRERVRQFLDGTYTGPLIDLNDSTYGDIVYE